MVAVLACLALGIFFCFVRSRELKGDPIFKPHVATVEVTLTAADLLDVESDSNAEQQATDKKW